LLNSPRPVWCQQASTSPHGYLTADLPRAGAISHRPRPPQPSLPVASSAAVGSRSRCLGLDLHVRPRKYGLIMKLDDTARQLIGSDPATLVTINRDGSPQISVVWVTVRSTADGGDELVTAHLQEHQKIRNIRRDPRVAVTIVSTDRSGPQTPYLSIKGTARVEEGGAPELLDEIATTIFGPDTGFPPPGAPPGYLTHITIGKVGGVGPWAS